MRILLIGDEESEYIWEHFDAERFKGVELTVSCGDLDPRYLSFLATMIPAPLIYVHGNHDHRYLKQPPEGCFSIDNAVYTYKGIRFFGLGGCRGMRGPALQEFNEKQMAQRLRRRCWDLHRSKGFDVLVTHAPAAGLGDMDDSFHRGFDVFRNLHDKYAPRYHFYGHVHLRYGVSGKPILNGNTTCINACGYKIIDI